MKALVTGATGLIGGRLLSAFPGAAVLSRSAPRQGGPAPGGGTAWSWEPQQQPPPDAAFEGVDAVFHLAGEPVAEGRWNAAKKRRIEESRVLGTRHLVAALRGLQRRPRVLVCASAVGIYGDRGDEELDEASTPGSGFLAGVCSAWEREALAAEALGVRVVCARIGVVLARGGGALAKLLTPFKLGAGGRLGSGRQWMPWIHLDDVAGLLAHAVRTEGLRGPINTVAPQPVINAAFTRALARALHRPALLPVPLAALRVAFGEMSGILVASQRVLPKAALRTGYAFRYPELDGALAALLAPGAGGRAA